MANLTRRAFGHIVSALSLAAIGARAAGRPAARVGQFGRSAAANARNSLRLNSLPRINRAAAHSPPFTVYPSTLGAHTRPSSDSGHRWNQPMPESRALNRHNGRGLSDT
ncbi:MAG: hypothetical protein IPJ07_26775 [Acidobacteria bacterium]|nr:hypothetical protein [Acidobacteriota bacterium]